MENIAKIFTTVFFPAYMLVAFVWPSVRTYKNTGVNPFVFGNSDSATDYVGRLFKVNIALIPLTLIFLWIGNVAYEKLLPVKYLNTPAIQVLGLIFCIVSLGWTVIAQWQMGNSWRIGLDEENRTKLVMHGLFRFSRNPIFLGMLFTLAGFLLILPNAITLLAFCLGYVLIQVQIRIEEEFLLRQYGNLYLQYKSSTKRLI